MSEAMGIIVNASSGGESDESDLLEKLRGLLRKEGVTATVELARSGSEVTRLARKALDAGCRTLVAGGGDGTVSSLAALVAGTNVALGVLPLGTLNHFAKDLSIPLDIEKAVHVLAQGRTMQVDVGEVNGRVFINNSSLGLYPTMVGERELQQQRLGRSKWMALFWASLSVLGRYPMLRVTVTLDGQARVTRTPLVFIGNNEYEIHGFNIGTRKRLDAGTLCLYLPHRVGRFGLVWLAVRALFGRLRDAGSFEATCTNELLVETGRGHLHVAADGEVLRMESPLRYRICRGMLRVVVPGEGEGF